MSLYKPPNSSHWYISIYHHGQRVRRPTGTASRAEAKRYHDKVVADFWNDSKLDIPAGYTWTDAVKEWLLAAQRGAEDRYRLRWINTYFGNPALSSITPTLVSTLLALKRTEGASPGTLKRYISLIRAILNDAKHAAWLSTVPAMPTIKTVPGRVRWLTREDWQRLEPLLPQHLRQLARFTLATGLRRHNATHLRWDKVDMERRVAWVGAEDIKPRRALGVPLNDAAIAVLEEQRDGHPEWCFPYRGKPVRLTATRAWRQALTTAGIEDFTWHDLRHTWASWHIMNGTRLEELQQLGGWKTLDMVQRYTHLAPQHLARVADNVRPVSMTKL